jgi:hypothetical protein
MLQFSDVTRIGLARFLNPEEGGDMEQRRNAVLKFAVALVVGLALPLWAQQTGSIVGRVTSPAGEPLPGVSVVARSPVMPQARSVQTGASGEYRLSLLPPGTYELEFRLEGMAAEKRSVLLALQQTATVDVVLAPQPTEETIEVVSSTSLVNTTSTELHAALTADVIDSLPVGQEYRDLVKLIPGVQYTENVVRGPSAGGSGQDNTYQFDGVNVTLPLFGTLSAEPASHDIDQISVVKGGADARDFNRAGGFKINSISRSGTNRWSGMVSYQVQNESMTADRKTPSAALFKENKDWISANLGGPLVRDRLFFYLSYYRPTVTRENRSNLYGEVPDFDSSRNEYFGKLTFQPTPSLLIHGSYRTSDREVFGAAVGGEATAGTASLGNEATLDIGILEGTWVIDGNSFLTARFTDFANETQSRPDRILGFEPQLNSNGALDLANLDRMGRLSVPTPISGQTEYNAFIDPIIQRYGYLQNGMRVGGGIVGAGAEFNFQNFYRRSGELSYDRSFGSEVVHDLHFGYQWFRDEEDLFRYSNGWGVITVPGGRVNCPANSTCAGQKVYFQAQVQQQGITLPDGSRVPIVHSEYESQNIEINDSIKLSRWTFNAGVLLSQDTLYGQGLRRKAGTVSGFERDKFSKYRMYELDFTDMIQPRLGAIWAYDGKNTIYANFARYMPSASSLPRAASWARNLATLINVYFDQNGRFIGSTPEAASSGKWFQENMDPRTIDEYLVGTSRVFGKGWSGRLHVRYRYAYNFWEDTENNSRVLYNPPPNIPRELYIPNLTQIRNEIGGSTYVIAELDRSFTKYWEAGVEAEWRGSKSYFRGSYVWSHYYGNFDQDSTTTNALNDSNIFIGSSNIADGPGRQLWDYKYGNLSGDRRHMLKLFGFYQLPWRASAGAYAIYQSGQPWQATDVEFYRALLNAVGSTSTSSTNRYAEPAGSRVTDPHYQLDLNYTQDFTIADRFTVQGRLDVFNVFDKQTGYNPQENKRAANFGTMQSFYAPRRFQLALKFLF